MVWWGCWWLFRDRARGGWRRCGFGLVVEGVAVGVLECVFPDVMLSALSCNVLIC